MDLILLSIREVVARHLYCFEAGLPGEEDEQLGHALILTFEPFALSENSQVLQPVDLVIGENLH